MALTDKHATEISAQNAIVQLLAQILTATGTETTLTSVLNNVTSKIERIKGSGNYNRALTYHGTGTDNVITIVHTGTTLIGAETITETITYVDPAINGSNVTAITYS